MRIFILLFMLAPLFLWGQYPDNPRKLRLGFQTTGAGLTYIKDGAPAHTPGDDEDAWMVLDTANNVLYYWDETAGAWENILDDITQDTVFQITNVPDTTTLAPMQGDAFINSTADTLGLYNGAGWVLFFGGGSIEVADGLTILGDGTGGDPLRVDTTLLATRTYAEDILPSDNVTGTGTTNQFAYFTGANTLTSDNILNIGNTYSSLGGSLEVGADVTDDRAALNIVGTNILLGANQSTQADHLESNTRTGVTPTIAAIKMPHYIDGNGYVGLFFGYSSASTGNLIYFGGNQSFSGVGTFGVEPDRMYFKNAGSSGYADLLISSGRLRIGGINDFNAVPNYSLDIGGGTASIRLTPHSNALTNAGGLLSFKSGDNWFLGRDGTNEFYFAKSSVASFTPGSLLFAGTSGQAQQDNANFFVDDTNNRLGIGTSSPQRTAHIAGEARITDLDTDPATKIVGADADGDLSAAAPGTGLAFTAGGVLYADTAFLATQTDLPGTLYSVDGLIPDGRVATVEIAGVFTIRSSDGIIEIGDDTGAGSGAAITIDNTEEDIIFNGYVYEFRGPSYNSALLSNFTAFAEDVELGDVDGVGNSTVIDLNDVAEAISLRADAGISFSWGTSSIIFPIVSPGVNQVLGEGATDDNQLEWMDVVIDGGMTNDFLPRYDEASGAFVDSDIEDDGTTITAGFNRDEVEIIPLNSITMFVDNDSVNIYGPVTRIGSTDNDTYVRVVDSSPTLVDAKAEEIHLTGEIYAPALSEYSGGGYYNIVQLPGTKEIRYDTVYARVYGYLYGAPLDSLDLGGATDQASITGWTAGGYNSGHFTATDSSLIYSGPTRRVEVQFEGKLIGGAAGDVEIRIGYSTSAGGGTLVLPADQTERITLTGGSTRDQFYTSCQMQLADGYEIKARGARGDFGIREARLRVMQID